MRIVSVQHRTHSIGSAMANAAIRFDEMTASSLAVITDVERGGRPVAGFAFDSIGRYAHGGLAAERFVPRLLAADPASLLTEDGRLDPIRAHTVMMRNEKPGGNGDRGGAVGLLDAALWDLAAKLEDKPLWSLLAERYQVDSPHLGPVPVYGSCGHFEPGGLSGLKDQLWAARERGYGLVKIKVGGRDEAEDAARIEAALDVVEFGDSLAIDACGGLTAETADRFMRLYAGYGLAWVEEPTLPQDFALMRQLSERHPEAMATGENLFGADEVRNLLRYAGLRPDRDILQMDPLLAHGVPEYMTMIADLEARGWSRATLWPHAGHLFSFHVVKGLGLGGHEAAPDPSIPHGGYPEGTRVENGLVLWPEGLPGVGYEAKPNLFALMAPLVQG